jgi:hypothetical protein
LASPEYDAAEFRSGQFGECPGNSFHRFGSKFFFPELKKTGSKRTKETAIGMLLPMCTRSLIQTFQGIKDDIHKTKKLKRRQTKASESESPNPRHVRFESPIVQRPGPDPNLAFRSEELGILLLFPSQLQ